MKKNFLIILLLTVLTKVAIGQLYCGNEGEELPTLMLKSEADFNQSCFDSPPDGSVIRCVPVQIRVFRRTDGTGGITTEQANEMLAGLNAHFLESNIRFLPVGDPLFVDEDALFGYNLSSNACPPYENSFATDILPTHWTAEVLNIYVVEDFSVNGQGRCGLASTPANEFEYVFVRNNGCFTIDELDESLAHEVGHFFGLRHTHHWASSMCYSVDKELVDGSNCETAGDFICDTPADPNLSLGGNYDGETCSYVGSGTDANDDSYEPLTDNHMSYADYDCHTRFTSQQIQVMQCVYDTEREFVPCESDNCLLLVESFPYEENFETWPLCPTFNGATCDLPVSAGWQNSEDDQLDWLTDEGGTPSSNTGPIADVNPGTDEGNYLYVEASGLDVGYPSKKAIVYTPCFLLPSKLFMKPVFDFSVHVYGSNHVTGYLEVQINNGTGWTTLLHYNGGKTNRWFDLSIDLDTYVGDLVQLRFVAKTGNGFRSDFAIDAVSLTYKSIFIIVPKDAESATDSNMANKIATISPSVSVYPNPSTGRFFVEFEKEMIGEVQFELIDYQGRVVQVANENFQSGSLYEVDWSFVPAGVYFLRVISNQNTEVIPVIINTL